MDHEYGKRQETGDRLRRIAYTGPERRADLPMGPCRQNVR